MHNRDLTILTIHKLAKLMWMQKRLRCRDRINDILLTLRMKRIKSKEIYTYIHTYLFIRGLHEFDHRTLSIE